HARRIRPGRLQHRHVAGRRVAERERRHDGGTSGRRAPGTQACDCRFDGRCARRRGQDRGAARSGGHRKAGGGRPGDRRHDRQASRVRRRGRRRRGRRRDRGRPRSRRVVRDGVGRGARRRHAHCHDGGDEMTTTSSTATALEEIQAREAKHVLQTYRRNPISFVRGQGVRLFDSEGREYYDLLWGIGGASLGHAHPGVARAIAEQAQTLVHTSNLFFHPLQGQVAERLATLSGLPRTFFCNSGAEAVEACLKFARRYWYTKGEPRAEFIALEESFHGRTFGALSVTSDEHYRARFEPLLPGVKFVPVNDPGALRAAVSTKTAAIIVEPVQGEGGVRPLTPAFAAAISAACAQTGALLI